MDATTVLGFLRCKELQVGDIVKVGGLYARLYSINLKGEFSVQPIIGGEVSTTIIPSNELPSIGPAPITKDMLRANGFKEKSLSGNETPAGYRTLFSRRVSYAYKHPIEIFTDGNYPGYFLKKYTIKDNPLCWEILHVHEVQHLFRERNKHEWADNFKV